MVDIEKQVIYSSGEISIQPNVDKILDLIQGFELSISLMHRCIISEFMK